MVILVMNTRFLQGTCSLASLTIAIVALSGFSAQAQTRKNAAAPAPVPGTASTSSSGLRTQRQVAQNVAPGRTTLSGPSYIGIGGNLIGFGGDSPLSERSFAIISKIGLTNNLSLRPSVLVTDTPPVFLVPLTVDFPVQSVTPNGQINLAPYLGGGAVVSTNDGAKAGFLLTGGIDVPLSPQFTANAAANVGFIDGAEVGLTVGVGYNF